MQNRVVIVESPSKAKTINKYLGRGYEVIASYGHIRDLPSKDGSVDPDNEFAMIWELDGRGSKQISAIAAAVKDADTVILATDPDREGEAISWHLLEALKARKVLKDKVIQRVTFNAITKDSVTHAMANPRHIDQALVDAYLARRALDYLVGFQLSPVLWRKLPGARSAGRVQSVALRLVCDRESEIERFIVREYWSLAAKLATPKGEEFEARLVGADGQKITRLDIGSGAEAEAFKTALEKAAFKVSAIEAKPARRNPYPPFTTSTLQQEASRKLGLAPAITMRIAQKLYEGVEIGGETTGLITYMRTDGVDMAPEARAQVRAFIGKEYKEYLPVVPRAYTTKAKNAQEAHECIRPTDAFRIPRAVKPYLNADEFRLYELIWKRTIASQMESARLERTTVDILAEAGARKLELRATGQVVLFDGFLTLYTETSDDDEDEESRRLPAMAVADKLEKRALTTAQHFTEPPPRYSEASLIKRMEELGIGRPSTYAATLAVLRDREYVTIDKKRLVPEDKGRIVTAFLESFFLKYVEYDFTADLENDLDRISNAEVDWRSVLRMFWEEFKRAIESAKEQRTTAVLDGLNEHLGPALFKDKGDGSNPRACPKCGSGQLSLKLSKTGPFIGCSNYPECRFTRPFSMAGDAGEGEAGSNGDGHRILGADPATGLEITLRDGRFGPYIQLGEGEKPKRASLAKGMSVKSVTLEEAIALLSLPREVGKHPEDGEPILAAIGRYGPYVQHGKTYANLDGVDDVFTVGINRAVDLIASKRAGGARRFGGGAPAGKVLGQHPDGGDVTLRDGRYGAYVNWTTVNATLPKSANKDELTLEGALGIIAARIEATGGIPAAKPARGGRRPAAKPKAEASGDAAKPKAKTAAKKPAAKKPAAKKPASKSKA